MPAKSGGDAITTGFEVLKNKKGRGREKPNNSHIVVNVFAHQQLGGIKRRKIWNSRVSDETYIANCSMPSECRTVGKLGNEWHVVSFFWRG